MSSPSKRTRRPRAPGRPKTATNVREDLLQAAAELFAERGYSGVAIRDVTRTARVQIATLYHHYDLALVQRFP